MLRNLLASLPRRMEVILTAKGDSVWNGDVQLCDGEGAKTFALLFIYLYLYMLRETERDRETTTTKSEVLSTCANKSDVQTTRPIRRRVSVCVREQHGDVSVLSPSRGGNGAGRRLRV